MAHPEGEGSGLSESDDVQVFLREVKRVFENDKKKYIAFLEVFKSFKAKRVDVPCLHGRLNKLLQGHKSLALKFRNKFLPKQYQITEGPSQTISDRQMEQLKSTALSFVRKVKCDKQMYKHFLDTLNPDKKKHASNIETYKEVLLVFGDNSDLLEHARRFKPAVPEISPPLSSLSERNFSVDVIMAKRKRKRNITFLADRDNFNNCNLVTHGQEVMKHTQIGKEKEDDNCRTDTNLNGKRVKRNDAGNLLHPLSQGQSASQNEEKYMTHPTLEEHDFSKHCNPSYRLAREDDPMALACYQTKLQEEVLNRSVVLVKQKIAGYSKNLSRCEEILFKCEDDRFELDMMMESLEAAISHVASYYDTFKVESLCNKNHLTALVMNYIKQLYGEYWPQVVEVLHENPSEAYPSVLARLKQKQEELSTYIVESKEVLADVQVMVSKTTRTS